jgi:hypothetical protein
LDFNKLAQFDVAGLELELGGLGFALNHEIGFGVDLVKTLETQKTVDDLIGRLLGDFRAPRRAFEFLRLFTAGQDARLDGPQWFFVVPLKDKLLRVDGLRLIILGVPRRAVADQPAGHDAWNRASALAPSSV